MRTNELQTNLWKSYYVDWCDEVAYKEPTFRAGEVVGLIEKTFDSSTIASYDVLCNIS